MDQIHYIARCQTAIFRLVRNYNYSVTQIYLDLELARVKLMDYAGGKELIEKAEHRCANRLAKLTASTSQELAKETEYLLPLKALTMLRSHPAQAMAALSLTPNKFRSDQRFKGDGLKELNERLSTSTLDTLIAVSASLDPDMRLIRLLGLIGIKVGVNEAFDTFLDNSDWFAHPTELPARQLALELNALIELYEQQDKAAVEQNHKLLHGTGNKPNTLNVSHSEEYVYARMVEADRQRRIRIGVLSHSSRPLICDTQLFDYEATHPT